MSNRAVVVYIAGPLGVGLSRAENVERAYKVAAAVTEHYDARGVASYCVVPHSCCETEKYLNVPRGYEQWMAGDLAVLARCDVVVRLRGESPGADREEARARELGIPVMHATIAASGAVVWERP